MASHTSALRPGGGTTAWQKLRARVLARDGHRCQACGASAPLQVDHIVPRQHGGSDALSNLQTLCQPCHQRKTLEERRTQERERQHRNGKTFLDSAEHPVHRVSFSPRNGPAVSLTGDEPPGPPRFFPDPHPDRARSWGGDLQTYAAEVIGQPLLPWQAQVSERVLEVDAAGRWCHPVVLLLVPRQTGKSTWLRALCEWSASRGMAVICTSAKLQTVAQLMRRSQQRLSEVDGYKVLRSKEQPEIQWPGVSHDSDGYRWIGQAANAMLGRGFTADLAIVDEVQDVGLEALESLAPALSARPNPLTVLVGTAARGESELLNRYRDAGMQQAGTVCHIEWSAPPGSDHRDERVWRDCHPLWTRGKLTYLRQQLELHDENHIRSEYLCQPVAGGDEPWISLAQFTAARADLVVPARVQVAAVEDGRAGGPAAVALAWVEADGTTRVVGRTTDSLPDAWTAAGTAERVLCGATLHTEPAARTLDARPRGVRQTGSALATLRRLLGEGLRWDGAALGTQIEQMKVKEDTTGQLRVLPRPPSNVARAAAWAVDELRTTPGPPVLV